MLDRMVGLEGITLKRGAAEIAVVSLSKQFKTARLLNPRRLFCVVSYMVYGR